MKILFVFTGGTIGSTVHGDFIGTDSVKPYVLLEAYRRRYGLDIEYDIAEPYTALSENNTGETIRLLCESVGGYLHNGYNGIVVTHGTDTMQYSAAALSYAFADVDIPICIVSSNLPIEQEGANGLANLHAALRFICEVKTPGVFVPYQNEGEDVRIHRGTRLLESVAFSDRVASVYDSYYGTMREGAPFEKNPAYRELADQMEALGVAPLGAHWDGIMRLEPYPGKVYPDVLPDSVRYILHASYHSGTINTEDAETRRFFAEVAKRGVQTFLTGVAPGAAYDSTRAFGTLSIAPLCNLAPIAAFVKLWMWATLHPDIPATAELLQRSLAGDVIVQ